MKLYIPTTTLNFNNILSSETLSPKAFYVKRGYGYKRWETVAENCLENGILLYKEPFSFNRPSNGLDDYPMLIELEMDESEIAELEPCGDWGYKSSHSLMLTPVTTRFIFFLEEHKRIAMSKSETSAETKLTRLYCGRLSVESYPESSLEYDVTDFETPDNEALETDKRQNRIKGFAYGYTIGRMLSRTEPGVKKLNARYDVRDIVASIMSGGEGVVTKEQDETLARDLLLFDNYYVSLLGKIGKETADVAYSLLEKQSSGYNSKRKEYLSYLRESLYQKEIWDGLQQWITKFINEAEAEHADDYNIFDDDGQAEIAVMHGKLTKINDGAKYIDEYKMLVNDVFTSDEYNGKVSTFRMDLANDVTKCVKRKYEDKWEASEIRTYLNAMRHYVAGEQFTQPWTDGVLSSLTAVIMKGEDWEGLFRFMVSKGMCDYRYAFGLYGALNGFANLTRDFTDILFASENKQYTWNVYKEIHRQLTGVELNDMVKVPEFRPVGILKESKVGINEVHGNDKFYLKDEELAYNNNEHHLEYEVKEMMDSFKKGGGKLKKDAKNTIEDAIKISKNIHDFLNNIKGKSGFTNWKSNRFWTYCAKECELEYEIRHGKPVDVKEQNWLDLERNNNKMVGKSFDVEHRDEILRAINSKFPTINEKAFKCLENDLDWCLDPKYDKSKDGKERIRRFHEQLNKGLTVTVTSNGKSMKWKNVLYKELPIQGIIDFLNAEYDE